MTTVIFVYGDGNGLRRGVGKELVGVNIVGKGNGSGKEIGGVIGGGKVAMIGCGWGGGGVTS